MYNKEEIIAKALSKAEQQSVWGQWAEQGYWDEDFSVKPENLIIIFSEYSYANYSGEGYVFGYDTLKDSFFEVFGSHCSCYGLEGQWDEEYITLEELSNRLTLLASRRTCEFVAHTTKVVAVLIGLNLRKDITVPQNWWDE